AQAGWAGRNPAADAPGRVPWPRRPADPPDPGGRVPEDPGPAAARLPGPAGGLGHRARVRGLRRRMACVPGRLPPLAADPDHVRGTIMALTNLEVVSDPVSDQDRAKAFYAEQLGFAIEMDSSFGDGGGMRWVALRPPGSGTAITLVTWFDTMPAGSLKGAVLGCDDLEKTLADLEARGVSFHE